MKYALDTSVLVRILANKPQPLAGYVIASVARRIASGDTIVVPDIILPEAYYAMQHHYGISVLSCEKSFRRLPNAEVIP